MNEQMKFPGSEPVLPGSPNSIEENSPEFQALREKVREEMAGKGKLMDEKWVTYMTHMRIIKEGLDDEREKRRNGFAGKA